jgi:hypothetical protein
MMAAGKRTEERPAREQGGGIAVAPTEEERAALLRLGYDQAMKALEADDPVAIAVATEYILDYSEKVGKLLKEGKDYLELLAPGPELPAIERIAVELVLETVEEELGGEDV